ncbi:hypothetical protein SCHPADRAFT_934485 [Schizopora paradoxa]|uniref:Uncharacterized protein n=1 Tax=Schizopora paradoxa TaxID=27342 RepID=A0A0H2SFN8_9AGAM|nr:hypothetical protein SCHPADRAFT_934485 [Schizopora paradoxa]
MTGLDPVIAHLLIPIPSSEVQTYTSASFYTSFSSLRPFSMNEIPFKIFSLSPDETSLTILKRRNPARNADYFGALKEGLLVYYRPESSRDNDSEASNEMVVGDMERAQVSVVANHFLSVPSKAP